ncbi:MAG: hypothetical protein V4510_05820 [bacterium]
MNALDLLTARLFDYAGTFPPASLSVKDALAEAARAPRLVRPAILGTDMVVASADLRFITPKAVERAGFGDTACSIALVGLDAASLKRTLPRVQAFNAKNVGSAEIVSLEVHGKRFSSRELQAAAEALGRVRLFVEPILSDRAWAASGWSLIAMLGKLRGVGAQVGLKVRGSGPHAISNRSLVQLIPHVVAQKVPLKATAGLHHPLLEAEHQNELGFVNVAAALRLHQMLGEGFDGEAMLGCLYEREADAFSFDGELAWRGHAVSYERLGEAMDDLAFSIGTCSLQEPDQDLYRLFGPANLSEAADAWLAPTEGVAGV